MTRTATTTRNDNNDFGLEHNGINDFVLDLIDTCIVILVKGSMRSGILYINKC